MTENTRAGFSVVGWNINGIRTLDMKDVLEKLKADIVCVQETKISRDQLDEKSAFVDNFSSYFAFCRNRSGYSGVATFCRQDLTPVIAVEGLSCLLPEAQEQEQATFEVVGPDFFELFEEEKALAKYADSDGRCMMTQHILQVSSDPVETKYLTVFNVYCPRLRDDPSDSVNNREFKELFHNLLERRARFASPKTYVLIVGDLNISHKPIDVSDAEESQLFNENTFRRHLDKLFSLDGSKGFVDTFRMLHPNKEKAFSCWCTRINARENNYGTRIDYIIADSELAKYLDKAEIHTDIMGSDHCPISATFHTLSPTMSTVKPPSSCTKYFPELSGRQLKLDSFLSQAHKLQTPYSQNGNTKSSSATTSKKRDAPKQTSLKSFFMKIPKVDADSNSDNSESVSNVEPNSPSASGFEVSGKSSNGEASNAWKQLFKGPETPKCSGHSEPCLLRTVRKKGSNQGRQFWACPKGVGSSSDPNASCNFFLWVVSTKSSK